MKMFGIVFALLAFLGCLGGAGVVLWSFVSMCLSMLKHAPIDWLVLAGTCGLGVVGFYACIFLMGIGAAFAGAGD